MDKIVNDHTIEYISDAGDYIEMCVTDKFDLFTLARHYWYKPRRYHKPIIIVNYGDDKEHNEK